jgi:hypothetical protein
VEAEDSGSNPGGQDLEEHVLDVLGSEGALAWDDLLETLTEDIEDRLDEALDELQSDNRVKYSGREGGYTLAEGQ